MKTKINLLIVEDNVIIADDLQYTLESLGYNVLGSVISYKDAVDFLQKTNVDLVFLDISLSSEKTGIDVAEYINNNNKIPFIFLTSNSDIDTINAAAKTKPYAYLVKPFDKGNLQASIEIAINNYNSLSKHSSENIVFVKKNGLNHKVLIDDIEYIKSDNIYLELNCGDKKYLLRSTLKKFITKLPENFCKCHKSYIINLHSVEAFNAKKVIINQQEIPISPQFKEHLKNKLNNIE